MDSGEFLRKELFRAHGPLLRLKVINEFGRVLERGYMSFDDSALNNNANRDWRGKCWNLATGGENG